MLLLHSSNLPGGTHGFKIEPVADPDACAPRGRSRLVGERLDHVDDQTVAVGEKTDRGERPRDPDHVGHDHRKAPQREQNEQESAGGHLRNP
jgi:hypothetical protein